MTEYFEIHGRDGPARVGELRLSEPLRTPALVDDVREDAGSRWVADYEVPTGDRSQLTVLPHRAFPPGTDEPVSEAFAVEYPAVDYPNAVVVSPDTAADHGSDAYFLSTAQGIVGHAEAFVADILSVKQAIPDDAALGLAGVATPANVATLAAAGVDLVDADRAVVKGTQGFYLTTDGAYFLSDLDELPCPCDVCSAGISSFDRADCAEHNVAVLRAALATVRRRIDQGRLRDFLEGQARHENWLTAVLRRLDREWTYVEERTPVFRQAQITAATEDTLRRVEIQRFADRVTGRYRNRFDSPLVLVPCSATKPYSESQSHDQFHDAIQFRAHTVSMTSPIGVVPQELELTYPAQHYDAVVTGDWSPTEIDFVAAVLRRYLDRTEYPRVIAHVPQGGYRDICERVAAACPVPFEYTVTDHPTTTESLAALQRTLADELKYGKRERQHNTLKAIADYQFGDGAGDELFAEMTVRSRYPKLRAYTTDRSTQLAAMVPTYGLLALTLAGARRWVESDVPTRHVAIDDFVPHGSVLAPGVTDADDSIRPGDEVVVEGPSAFGVGRAATHGRAMVEGTRGVAVDVRHVTDR